MTALRGVGPDVPRQILTSSQVPFFRATSAATPTMDRSMADLVMCLRYTMPLPAGGFGTRTSVTSSSGANIDSPGARKKSSTATKRCPLVPVIFNLAPRTIRPGAMSAEGRALHRLPTTVARFLTCTEPSVAAACERTGNFSLISGDVSTK